LTNCGDGGESCCTALPVFGGTYFRTYSNSGGGATGNSDPATVSSFRLDKYLVTVGRFRQFVNAWNEGAGYTPPAGSGKHTHLNGGAGLNATQGGFEPGWASEDNALIEPTNAQWGVTCAGAGIVMIDTGAVADISKVDAALRSRGWRDDVLLAFGGGVRPDDLDEVQRRGAQIVDIGRAVLDAPLWDLRLEMA